MARYLLNSAVITAPGLYRYRLLSLEEAKRWFSAGEEPLSTIGYLETAEALSLILQTKINVNRTTITMQPRDEALVFRLVLPPGTPRIDPHDKGAIVNHVNSGHWELGLLVRIE